MSSPTTVPAAPARHWATEKLFLGMPFGDYLRSLATPGNFIAGLIMAVGIPLIAYRFIYGLGASTNLPRRTPGGSGSSGPFSP